jgi:broad specificity phosphatase PhoE
MNVIRSILSLLMLVLGAVAGQAHAAPPGDGQQALWDALRAGTHVALVRHAIAPGTGDPAGFALDDCATQRNLSSQGRLQAEAVGARLRGHGIGQASVYSSAWCRCLETARLLAVGKVDRLPLLDSFFRRPERRDAQTAALRAWLAQLGNTNTTPVVLVTHQVNITALTGVYPAQGALLVVGAGADGTVDVLGVIDAD